MAPPAHRLLGRRVGGRYEVVAHLGRGAMADVFRARDLDRGAFVALKLVPAELVTSSVAAARFQREVKAASKLDHPAIVRVHGWGVDSEHGFIAMDLVEGEDLYERLRAGGARPVGEAIEIARQVLQGLEAAHAEGVIHRDLKPENVMIAPDGRIRILDFGIAKLYRPAGDEEETMPESLTLAGTAVGTPTHMAPEQARGGHVDGRVDLYAVGVLLYEMVTGRLPFEGQSALDVVLMHLRDPPVPPRRYAPALPPALEAVILRALAKDPAGRPPNALAMRRELEAVRAELDDELDVPTRAEGAEVDAPTVDRQGQGTSDRPAPADGVGDEPTIARLRDHVAGDDEDPTNVVSRLGRLGPAGTLVDGPGARALAAAIDEEETTHVVPPLDAEVPTTISSPAAAAAPPSNDPRSPPIPGQSPPTRNQSPPIPNQPPPTRLPSPPIGIESPPTTIPSPPTAIAPPPPADQPPSQGDGRLGAGDGRLGAGDGRLGAGDGRLGAGDGRAGAGEHRRGGGAPGAWAGAGSPSGHEGWPGAAPAGGSIPPPRGVRAGIHPLATPPAPSTPPLAPVASTPPPAGTELDRLLRQLPAGRTLPWRAIVVAVGLAALAALVWLLST